MNWARTGALARRIITQFRRDRRTLALVIFVPIFLLSLVDYLTDADTTKLRLGVVNQEPAQGGISLASKIIAALQANPAFEVRELSRDEVDSQIREGKIEAALVLPPGLTTDLLARRRPSVDLILEGSDPATTAATMSHLSTTLALAMVGLFAPQPPDGLPLELRTSYLYGGPQFQTLDYFAPVLISVFVFILVFILTSVSFLRERAQGTMERLMASPLTKSEIVLGYMLGFGFFALLQSTVILLFTIFVLRLNYVGNPLILFLIVFILTIGSVNMGIFLSSFARNELQVVQFIPLVIVPQILLGGVIWPIEDMPRILQWVAYFLPITYANDALRGVMIRGYSLGNTGVALDTLALVAFAGLMILFGALTLRREIA